MQRVLDWLFTVPFLLAFGLHRSPSSTRCSGSRGCSGSARRRSSPARCSAVCCGPSRICGTRLEVERSPAIRPWTPYLIVANHQSMFDIPIFGGLLFSNFPKYISKRELARWIPEHLVQPAARRQRDHRPRRPRPGARRPSARSATQVRERGVSAVIYPEGTRARHGTLGEFKPKGFLELLDAAPGVAVLPVAIDNSWQAAAPQPPAGAVRHARARLLRPAHRPPRRRGRRRAPRPRARPRSTRCCSAGASSAARRAPRPRSGGSYTAAAARAIDRDSPPRPRSRHGTHLRDPQSTRCSPAGTGWRRRSPASARRSPSR